MNAYLSLLFAVVHPHNSSFSWYIWLLLSSLGTRGLPSRRGSVCFIRRSLDERSVSALITTAQLCSVYSVHGLQMPTVLLMFQSKICPTRGWRYFYQTQTTRRPPKGPKNVVFVPGDLDFWCLTLTFKLVRAMNQTSSIWICRKSIHLFPRYLLKTPFFCPWWLVTLTFDLDLQTRPSKAPNMSSLCIWCNSVQWLPLNWAVPEIFPSQTKKSQTVQKTVHCMC